MKFILRSIDKITDSSGRIFSYLMYVGMLILAAEVVLRYFFNSPTVWAHGYTQRIFGSYFVLIGAFTLIRHSHVRIDLLYSRFTMRKRAFFDVLNYLFLLIWGFALVKEGWDFFSFSYMIREVDEMVLAHPVYPVKFILVVGVALISLQGISRLFLSLYMVFKGEEYDY